MPFKLSKKQIADMAVHHRGMVLRQNLVELAVNEFNEKVEALFEHVTDAINAFNEEVELAGTFVEELRDQFQSELDEKSETFQEGDRGRQAAEWISQIDDAYSLLLNLEVEVPEAISVAFEQVEVLDNIPPAMDT